MFKQPGQKEQKRPPRPRVRGDLIPPVSDYSHWNEDAQRIWYEENRYDMEYWDEPIEYDEKEDFDGDE